MTTLTTSRLRLRPPRAADADPIFTTYARDPEVTRYLLWPPHRTLDDTRDFLTGCQEAWGDGSGHPWVIEDRRSQALLGMIDLRGTDDGGELGFVLARPAWGKGYATEAVREVVRFAVEELTLDRVVAHCHPDNAASRRVLEKAGLRLDGRVRRHHRFPTLGPGPREVLRYVLERDGEN